MTEQPAPYLSDADPGDVCHCPPCTERRTRVATHSTACYQWHLECALTRIRRLSGEIARRDAELIRLRGSEN